MDFSFLKKQCGFTLVEVLTVMLVLVALASITIEVSSEVVFQNRFNVTKDRYEKIKKAIIGNSDIFFNGQPNITGFVADVGRLPFALQELIEGQHCPDTRYFTQSDCDTSLGAGSWVVTPNWNGPYISSTKAYTNEKALSDGWGNSGLGNYGWHVTYYISDEAIEGSETTTIANAKSMFIQSNGSSSSGVYGLPYPASGTSIRSKDWLVNINKITVNIITDAVGSCSAETCSNPIYPDQSSCIGTWTNHNAKNNCEGSGKNWIIPAANVCLGIKKGASDTSFIAKSDNASIKLDGHSHLVTFLNMTPASIELGKFDIGIYSGCDPELTFLSACEDSASNANFTKSNCETNGGYFVSGSPNYCYNLSNALNCTGTTAPQLGGTIEKLKPEVQFTLSPNMTFPTINW